MAEIIPFRGIYYVQKKAGSLDKLTAPPYDVISHKEQEKLYRTGHYNVIRLILGKTNPEDTRRINRNTRAAEYFQDWLDKGILKKEAQAAIYVYQQKYVYGNKIYTPLGFIALSRLEEWQNKKVLPHEVIFDKFKTDRLRLLRATKANFESILSLYFHSTRIERLLKKAIKRKPFLEMVDENKVKHSIFVLRDKGKISIIQEEMKKRPLFIGDGHHRYQAALNFSKEITASKSSKYKAAGYLITTFMDIEKSNLTIFPTHRLIVNLSRFSYKRLFDILAPYFQIRKVSSKDFYSQLKETGKKCTAFGLYLGGERYFLIKLKPEVDLPFLIKEKKSLRWKKLDVTILHKLILERLLGNSLDKHLYYTREAKEAERKVKTGKAKLAFFLNPIKIEDIQAIASRGERMPQKSTYFYPKLRSGLIMRQIEEE